MTLTDTAPAGTLRKLAQKRARLQDDLVADYLATVVKPGDRTLQLGKSQFGVPCLGNGAFHQVLASDAAVDSLRKQCAERGISTDRLQTRADEISSRQALDLVLIGKGLGFADMAGNWRDLAARLKVGGVLVINGVDRGAAARLADALFTDKDWAFEDMIGGEAAIYRKIRVSETAVEVPERASLKSQPAATPKRRPGGLMAGVLRTLFASAGRPSEDRLR